MMHAWFMCLRGDRVFAGTRCLGFKTHLCVKLRSIYVDFLHEQAEVLRARRQIRVKVQSGTGILRDER